MSYYSDVAVAFFKKDWEEKILPTLSPELIAEVKEGKTYTDGECIAFRWDDVNHWEEGKLYEALKPFVKDDDLICDYFVASENSNEYGIEQRCDLGFVRSYTAYFRFENEVGMDEADNIGKKLVGLLLSKGVSMDEIKAAVVSDPTSYYENTVGRQVELYAERAKAA